MLNDHSAMTVPVAPLNDPRNDHLDDLRDAGGAAQRIAAVSALTLHAWTLAGRALPAYTRATMPVVVTTRSVPPLD
jgi:hypothetical protein